MGKKNNARARKGLADGLCKAVRAQKIGADDGEVAGALAHCCGLAEVRVAFALFVLAVLAQVSYAGQGPGGCSLRGEDCIGDYQCCDENVGDRESLVCDYFSRRCELQQNNCGGAGDPCSIEGGYRNCCNGLECRQVQGYRDTCMSRQMPDLRFAANNQQLQARGGESAALRLVIENAGNAVADEAVMEVQAAQGVRVQGNRYLGIISAGGRVTRDFEITCPRVEQQAEYQVVFALDADAQIPEGDENNNEMAKTIACLPPARPNLVVEAGSPVVSPQRLQQGQQVVVNAFVRNSGEAAANAVSARATPIGNPQISPVSQQAGNLQAGGRSNQLSFEFTCPSVNDDTSYAVQVVADAQGVVSESNENDNMLVPLPSFACVPNRPDLVVESFVANPQSARAGGQILVGARVRNVGNEGTGDAQITAEASVQGEEGQPQIATQRVQIGRLGAGQSAQVEYTFTCPHVGDRTTYNVLIAADSAGAVEEGDENNNVLRGSLVCEPFNVQAGAINMGIMGAVLLLALAILALVYMGSYVFGQPHLRAIVQDEAVHLLAAAVVLLAIVALNNALDLVYAPALAQTAGGERTNLQLQANAKLVELGGELSGTFGGMRTLNENLGYEGSKSVYCSFLGAGYSLVSCSTLNMMRGGVSQGLFAVGGAIADVNVERMLLSLSRLFAFSVLLPVGLFLYAFRFTRAGGAALIAIAVGFYVVHPLLVLFFENTLVAQVARIEQGWVGGVSVPTDVSCKPQKQDFGQISGVQERIANPALLEQIMFQSLVRGVFATIVKIMAVLAFVRAFAALLGSEIDVSTLARIS